MSAVMGDAVSISDDATRVMYTATVAVWHSGEVTVAIMTANVMQSLLESPYPIRQDSHNQLSWATTLGNSVALPHNSV